MVWLEVRILSGPPRSRLLPEISSRCTKGPELTGICATVRSQRRHRYSRQVVSAHFSLAPKSRFPETETAREQTCGAHRAAALTSNSDEVCRLLQRVEDSSVS